VGPSSRSGQRREEKILDPTETRTPTLRSFIMVRGLGRPLNVTVMLWTCSREVIGSYLG
jgi:hypothetical protein